MSSAGRCYPSRPNYRSDKIARTAIQTYKSLVLAGKNGILLLPLSFRGSSLAYEDWDPDMREVYDNATAFTWLSESEDPNEHYTAEMLFEYGWVYDAGRNNPEVRETFYDFTGTDERDIDWDSWREYWGYQ